MAGRVVSFLLVGIVYNLVVEAIVAAFVAQNSVAFELVVNILTVPLTLATVGVAIVAYAELRHHEDPRVTSHVLAGELRA
jgi:cell division protein FtsX